MKPALFLCDAEKVHEYVTTLIRRFPWIAGPAQRVEAPVEVWGLRFRNGLGLAAGFDKNAHLLQALAHFGFGFAEVGTVTLHPQPGNPRPRLFRLSEQEALFNAMGFNNEGAQVVARRLAQHRRLLPQDFQVGVNIGINKDCPPDRAARDYQECLKYFEGLASYVVINVSSPNTPGLRDLQNRDRLGAILESVGELMGSWQCRPPLLVKFSPEFPIDQLTEMLSEPTFQSVRGVVLTNTLGYEHQGRHGGLSGRPLTEVSRSCLEDFRRCSKLPVVSVGGIHSEDEAFRRKGLGANLIQIYTAWIYGGPFFPARLARAFSKA